MEELVVRQIRYTYPRAKEPTLKDISFSADAGRVTALIGPNGAGKTTLIRAIVKLVRAEGSVQIRGKELTGQHSEILKNAVSYLTQESTFLSELTVFEMVLMGKVGSLGLRIQEENLQKVWHTLQLLHLEDLADRPYYALSGGQRKMVNIAQAIVKDPQVLILDEPTANLDMQKTLEVMELVTSYTRAMGITTLVTLHDLNTASHFADRLILIKDGTVFAQGSPRQVLTEEAIRSAYGVNVRVDLHGTVPHIHPISSVRDLQFDFCRGDQNAVKEHDHHGKSQ